MTILRSFRFVIVVLIISQANLAPESRLAVESVRLGVAYVVLVTADSVLTSMQRWCPRAVYRSPYSKPVLVERIALTSVVIANQGGRLRT